MESIVPSSTVEDYLSSLGALHAIPWTPHFKFWTIFVPVCFFFFFFLFRILNWWPERARKGGRLSDIMAFMIVCLISCGYLGIAGTIGWFDLNPAWSAEYKLIARDRLYGRAQFVEDHLIAPMVPFQLWNVVFCMCYKDFRAPEMFAHHILTAILGYYGLHPYLHYYGLFFFGFAELTNIPLTIYDTFKYFKKDYHWDKRFPSIYGGSQASFGISFLVIRTIMWPIVSYRFWEESLRVLQQPHAHNKFAIMFFLLANVFLTGLQLFWTGLILKSLTGRADRDEKIKDRKSK